MRLSDSERDGIEFALEELKGLADLLEQILDRNSDSTSASPQELRDLSAVWEATLETARKLKMIRRINGRTTYDRRKTRTTPRPSATH